MIFISVGTSEFKFDRLLKIIDELCEEKKIDANEIFAQIGYTEYRPKYYKYKKFLSKNEMDDYVNKCEYLITHSGAGIITLSLSSNKKVIVFPRLKQYNEHVDNHQIEIAESFKNKGYIIYAKNKEELQKCISDIEKFEPKKFKQGNSKISSIINDYIDSLEKKYENKKS